MPSSRAPGGVRGLSRPASAGDRVRYRAALLAGPAWATSLLWAPVAIKTGSMSRSVPCAPTLKGPSSPAGRAT
eukprot:2695445-Alexandrium_andersonii.AAC.1